MLITLEELDLGIPTMRVSPDGHQVAVPVDHRPIPGGPPQAQLAVVRVDDPQTRIVVSEIGGFPIWSPDSRQIAFIGQSPGGMYQLYVVKADGTGLSQLTDLQPPHGSYLGSRGPPPSGRRTGWQIATW